MNRGKSPQELAGRGTGWRLRAVFSWRRVLVFCAASAALGGAIWRFQKERKVSVALSFEYDPRSLAIIGGADGRTHTQLIRDYLETQIVVMTSHGMCAYAAEEASVHPSGFRQEEPQSKERFAGRVCQELEARRIGESLVIELKYADSNPERAELVVGAVAEAYLRRSLSVRTDPGYLEQWAHELESRDAEVGRHEFALATFSREHKIASLETERALAASALQAYAEALTEARIRRIRIAAKVAQLDQAQFIPLAQEDRELSQLRGRVQELESEKRRLLIGSDGQHPRLPAVLADLEAARARFDEVLGAAKASAHAELAALQTEEKELLRNLEQAQRAALELTGLQVEYARLQRAVTRDEAVRTALLGQIGKSRSGPSAEGWLVRVLSPAHRIERMSMIPVALAIYALLVAVVFVGQRPTDASRVRREDHLDALS